MWTRNNIERFGGLFPHVSTNGTYELNANTEWTAGFWTGILWLCYEYSNDSLFRDAAIRGTESFRNRLVNKSRLDNHDVGFLYSLSSKGHWIIENDQTAKDMTLQAAGMLMKRSRAAGRYIQAWGPEGDEKNGGRIIIDCLMNLPLLYWASRQTNDQSYRDTAVEHAEKSLRYLVRGDNSSYHTFYFDTSNGEPIRGATHQGYKDGSTWTRGQAWGIYGFALSYRYTGNPQFLEASARMARYFIERVPEDHVAYWDFDNDAKRDSSASAIMACGTLELLSLLPDGHPERSYFEEAVRLTMTSLVQNYSTIGDKGSQGLIEHGSYNVNKGVSPDDFVIWGDYFYLEALMRLEQASTGYWYEQ
jgi:unsaturated chondroitin disaccharide hydrolase